MASGEYCSLQENYMSAPRTLPRGLSHVVLSRLEGVQQIMMGFHKKMNHVFAGGDPVVAEWFLVRETYLPFLLCGCYVLFCTVIGPAVMRNRKPFDLRKLMIVFSFTLAAIYTFAFIFFFTYLRYATWQEFCYGGYVRKEDYTYKLACLAHTMYIVKYVEFLDTVFFVLRKKENQMSFLHIFHHAVVPLIAWALLRTETNGIQSIPGIINGFVHIVMYTYYGLAALGPQVQKHLWWKKYLTQMQIAQFLIIFLFATIVAPMTGCKMVIVGKIMVLGAVSIFFYLFYQFYRDTFRQEKELKFATSSKIYVNGNSKTL